MTKTKKKKGTPGVYFALSSSTERVKIGRSKNIEARVKTLRTGSADRLEIVGIYCPEGTENLSKLEAETHRRFAEFRVHLDGPEEWFTWCKEIRDFVRNYCKPGHQAPAPEKRTLVNDRVDSGKLPVTEAKPKKEVAANGRIHAGDLTKLF